MVFGRFPLEMQLSLSSPLPFHLVVKAFGRSGFHQKFLLSFRFPCNVFGIDFHFVEAEENFRRCNKQLSRLLSFFPYVFLDV